MHELVKEFRAVEMCALFVIFLLVHFCNKYDLHIANLNNQKSFNKLKNSKWEIFDANFIFNECEINMVN